MQMQALVTSAEGGRTGRGRLGREEKNAVAASESIINDMGGKILSKVVCEYTSTSACVWYVHTLFVVQYSPGVFFNSACGFE